MERFWSKVRRGEGCWIWLAGASHGYGAFKLDGKVRRAHVVAWMLTHGTYPDLYVCHRCDTPLCVRPDHLFLGTQTDNMRDASNKGRSNQKLTAHERREMAILVSAGFTWKEVGEMYGVHNSMAGYLL